MRGEGGQATVEWAGLVLLVVLVLAALGGVLGLRPGRAPASARGLDEVVAERFTCAARGACGGAPGTRPGAAPPSAPAAALVPRGITRAQAVDALRRLRSVGAKLVRRA